MMMTIVIVGKKPVNLRLSVTYLHQDTVHEVSGGSSMVRVSVVEVTVDKVVLP